MFPEASAAKGRGQMEMISHLGGDIFYLMFTMKRDVTNDSTIKAQRRLIQVSDGAGEEGSDYKILR